MFADLHLHSYFSDGTYSPEEVVTHGARFGFACAVDIGYDNFKSEVAHHQGKSGAAYEHSLHEVWSVMHELQT